MTGPTGPMIWREGRTASEAAGLLTSGLWRGRGVERGEGRPVLLVPGFMAGDASLMLMTQWLRRMGYRAHASGITRNVECSEKSVARLEQRARDLAHRYGRPLTIIGHSRGGMFGRVVGVRQPECVDQVITLGSPLVANMDDFHALLRLQIRALQGIQRLGGGGLVGDGCEASWEAYTYGLEPAGCCTQFWTDMDDDLPAGLQLTSIFSRSDGILRWRSCLDPQAEHVEVRSSHCGMAVNPQVYRVVGERLAAPAVVAVRRRATRAPVVALASA